MKYLFFFIASTFSLQNLQSSTTKQEFKNFLKQNAAYVKDCQDNRVYLKEEYIRIGQKCLILLEANEKALKTNKKTQY